MHIMMIIVSGDDNFTQDDDDEYMMMTDYDVAYTDAAASCMKYVDNYDAEDDSQWQTWGRKI